MKPVLRIPVYRRLFAAYTLNEFAFMVGTVALTLLIYKRTGSAFGATGFFLCSQFVPALISPWVVARLDQLPPRPVLPLLYWLEAVIFVALAGLAGRHFNLVTVLALTLVNGVLALTARSLARATTVAVTSAAGLLREGNALANAGFSVAFLIGPGLGGAAVAAGGTSQALLGDAVVFGVVGLTLATATGMPQPRAARAPARGRVRAALEYARERPSIRGLLILQTAAILFFTVSTPVEVVLVTRSLHAGAAAYGAMVSAWGAGAVFGAAVYARWHVLPQRNLMALGSGLLGVGFVVMAISPTLAVAIVGAALAGIGNGIESVAGRTAVQELVEERWMALIMSVQESMFQAIPGAGILLGGTIAALASPRVALGLAGAGSLAVTALVWVLLAELGTRPAPPPDAAPPPEPLGSPVEPETQIEDDSADGPGTNGEAEADGTNGSTGRDHAATPAARHQ